MNAAAAPQPHGGDLKFLVVDAQRAATLKELSFNLPDITLSDHHLCDLELMATGAFSPLEGFMVQADYESVIDRMRLQDDTLWPIPITLDISKNKANSLEAGQSAALRDPEGFLLAVMHIEDIWRPDKEREAQGVYNSSDKIHPGVRHLFNEVKEYYVGGRIEVISLPLHYDFKQLRQTPSEVRSECQKFGWQRVVGYQTSSVIHRQQYEITLEAMRRAKANLLLLPIVGISRTEEFDYYTRVRCYKKIMRQYPPDTHILSLLPHFMRLSGPREAILNAIIAKNYGCTHCMVCHDHADPYIGDDNTCYYDGAAVEEVVDKCKDDLGIPLFRFEEMVYLSFEDEHRFINTVPKGTKTIKINGKDIRDRIRTGPSSVVTLLFFDGSTTELDASTEVTVVRMDSQRSGEQAVALYQAVGQTYNRVEPLSDRASHFEIETPTAVATVRTINAAKNFEPGCANTSSRTSTCTSSS